ncbi:MAG: Stk1 family PASTA domain-containing Ser/Thr kinase [Clostridia bacterium]|nr:Stk1 family PASTA domain-containing Ser/Thr kinase [Clostridia bacterium]
MDKYIGKRLDGRYEIREIIGVGGMAYVYKAYDNVDDRIVAVKILKDEYLRNEEFSRRFKNESKAIAILSHPNIVRVSDVSFGDNLQYIVMEYIDGITLKEYIEQQKVLPWKEVVYFITQILQALQHAHDKGIVHQDVKPQNILLLADGTIKMTDFGIARFSRASAPQPSEQGDKAIGSVHYISPEQARAEVTDEKSDIYSVGVMMYEMLTGKLPFESNNAVSVAIMQMQNEPERPQSINPDIPDGLEEITLKAMQKDPHKRYQSAAEMLYDIDEFKENPSIRFEYKYFSDPKDDTEHYRESFNRIRSEAMDTKIAGLHAEIEENKKKGPPVIPILAGIAGALILVSIVIFAIYFITGFIAPSATPAENISVPNLVGKNYETEVANNTDLAAKFVIKINQEYSDKAAGTIIRQYPLAGKEVKVKTELTLYISRGEQLVTIPTIKEGESKDSAVNKLKAAGFQVNMVPTNSDTVEKGCVVRISPEAGAKKPKNSTVTLYISNGPEPEETTEVPDVTGEAQADAIKKLSDKGFYVDSAAIKTVNHPSYSAGTVVSQSPSGGESATSGSEVKLVVSSGYKDVDVNVHMPSVSSTVDVEVYVDGSLWDSESSVLPSGSPTIGYTFTENSSSYKVTVRLSPSGESDFETYAEFEIDGERGTVKSEKYYAYTEPSSLASATTTTLPDEEETSEEESE